MSAIDDGILALLDAHRPSSRAGRRPHIKKKVSFSNTVKENKESESKQKERDQFSHEETDQIADQNALEVRSFSRPSRESKFKYGSLDELFCKEGRTSERLSRWVNEWTSCYIIIDRFAFTWKVGLLTKQMQTYMSAKKDCTIYKSRSPHPSIRRRPRLE